MSVGRAFHRRAAAELKALSPTRRRVRDTKSSEFVAERRLVWRWSEETGCSIISMSEMYAGAVLFNDWYTSMHILNSIRAATGSQCKSISALVRQDVRLHSKLAVVVREWTVATQKVWYCHSPVYLWQMLTQVALPPGVPTAGEPDVDIASGRNIFVWSSRSELACSSGSRTACPGYTHYQTLLLHPGRQ